MKTIVFSAFAALALAGCASQAGHYSARTYSNGLQQQQVQLGTVVAIQHVKGRGSELLGQVIGLGAGAAIGSQIGSGSGSGLAAVAGGVLGAFGGSDVEQHLTSKTVEDITVRLDSGQLIGVVEKAPELRVGERVQVIHNRGSNSPLTGGQGATVRVLPLSTAVGSRE